MVPAFSENEIDQLKHAAQMFEMILDTGAEADEAYQTLKDVYGKLRMEAEFKRVAARYARYLLAHGDRGGSIAQLAELAERYPDDAKWRERLAALGAPVPAGPSPASDLADGPVSRDAVHAFSQLKAIAEFQALEMLRASGNTHVQLAIKKAEQILSGFDRSMTEAAPAAPQNAPAKVAARSAMTGRPASPPASVARPAPAAPIIQDEEELKESQRLGEMLVERGVITTENLEAALARQRETGRLIGELLVELDYATEADVLDCLTEQAGVPYLPLALYEVPPEVMPVDLIANSVVVTTSRSLSTATKQAIEQLLEGRKINYYISATSEIEQKIEQLYP